MKPIILFLIFLMTACGHDVDEQVKAMDTCKSAGMGVEFRKGLSGRVVQINCIPSNLGNRY